MARQKVRARSREQFVRDEALTPLEEERMQYLADQDFKKQFLRSFTKLPSYLISAVGYDHLGVMCWLIHWESRKGKPANRGWFFCPYAVIGRHTGIDQRKIQKEVAHYVDLGVLERRLEYRKPHPRQWLRIRYQGIWEMGLRNRILQERARQGEEIEPPDGYIVPW